MMQDAFSEGSREPLDGTTKSTFEERRNAMRFPRDPGMDFAEIQSPSTLAGTVEVVDESLGGLAVMLPENATIEIDQQLQLRYAGGVYRATIRHITSRTDGYVTVGIACHPVGDAL